MTRSMAPSICQHLGQVDQDPGGGAPDVAPLIGEDEKTAAAPASSALDALMVVGIENEGERHLEGLGDLVGIDRQREGRRDDADDRSDLEAGPGDVSIEAAHDADPLA